MNKSSRHSKITGDFGEALILYWLSKDGFECASVDHTGIDLIARNPHTKELMGISVKSRSRNPGKEETSLRIDTSNIQKILNACKAFECQPYTAVVIDANERIMVFLLSLDHLQKIHPPGKTSITWSMSKKWLKRYSEDQQIMCFSLAATSERWWSDGLA